MNCRQPTKFSAEGNYSSVKIVKRVVNNLIYDIKRSILSNFREIWQ